MCVQTKTIPETFSGNGKIMTVQRQRQENGRFLQIQWQSAANLQDQIGLAIGFIMPDGPDESCFGCQSSKADQRATASLRCDIPAIRSGPGFGGIRGRGHHQRKQQSTSTRSPA